MFCDSDIDNAIEVENITFGGMKNDFIHCSTEGSNIFHSMRLREYVEHVI